LRYFVTAQIGFVFSTCVLSYVGVSDLELRASDFRAKPGFGFVFSNEYRIKTADLADYAEEKKKIVNRKSKIINDNVLHSQFSIRFVIYSTNGNPKKRAFF